MGRRLLSHLLITLAIFTLSLTFFIWVVDGAVLNPKTLNKALKDGGVPSAIASIIPDQASKGEDENQDQQCNDALPQQGQPGVPAGNMCANQPKSEEESKEEAEMKAKIASVVTPDYVDQKLQAITTSVITFMKNGEPKPVIDISDFPEKLRANGIEVKEDMAKEFGKPIQLAEGDKLSAIPKAYNTLKLAKFAGIILCVLLLVAEYFVAAKGDKMHRIGRIFLHVAFWYTVWWAALTIIPSLVLPKLKDKVQAGESINTLIDALSKSVQHLLAQYFLAFAVVCWIIAITLYLIRHSRKHIDKIQAVPTVKRGKTTPTPNKR